MPAFCGQVRGTQPSGNHLGGGVGEQLPPGFVEDCRRLAPVLAEETM